MRTLAALLCLQALTLTAQTSDEKDAVAVCQKLFDAMTAHDGDALRALMLPDARFVAIRQDGTVSSTPGEQFATRIAGLKEPVLERMWNPKTLIRGRMAEVWAEYDFHRGAVFSHCGVDSFSLVKTAEGWKLAGIIYTTETAGCAASPLGPPEAPK